MIKGFLYRDGGWRTGWSRPRVDASQLPHSADERTYPFRGPRRLSEARAGQRGARRSVARHSCCSRLAERRGRILRPRTSTCGSSFLVFAGPALCGCGRILFILRVQGRTFRAFSLRFLSAPAQRS